MVRRYSNLELWLALAAIFIITMIYLGGASMLNGVPSASGLFGHSIGIAGFLLMLSTETLYSLRKRSRRASWGRMSTWLQFHIFTGIVGPYMVLLHSSWKFNGLAGVLMLMTVVIVASGFLGRYIYTAVPRTVDGVEVEAGVLEAQISATEAELKRSLAAQPEPLAELARRQLQVSSQIEAQRHLGMDTGSGANLVLARPLLSFAESRGLLRQLRHERQRLDPASREQAKRLEELLNRRQQLRRQRDSLAAARRLLALWHSVHIPIGMALFTAALIHIVAAIYYATLMR